MFVYFLHLLCFVFCFLGVFMYVVYMRVLVSLLYVLFRRGGLFASLVRFFCRQGYANGGSAVVYAYVVRATPPLAASYPPPHTSLLPYVREHNSQRAGGSTYAGMLLPRLPFYSLPPSPPPPPYPSNKVCSPFHSNPPMQSQPRKANAFSRKPLSSSKVSGNVGLFL